MVERIAGWSTRHRKIAVFGWLAMVLAIVALGQLMGSRNLPVYDPGQAGQGEQALHHVAPATLNQLSESVSSRDAPAPRPSPTTRSCSRPPARSWLRWPRCPGTLAPFGRR